MGFWEDQSTNNYWSKAAVAQREAEKQGRRPDNSGGNDPWGDLGGILGGIGNNIGNAAKGVADWAVGESRLPQRSGHPGQSQGAQTMPNQIMGGNSGTNNDLFSLLKPHETGAGMLARPPEESQSDKILKRLGERFSYDGSQDQGNQENLSALDGLLKGRMDELNNIRGQTNDNFNKSDGNVAAMHSAFQNEVRGQAPEIQQRGDAAQANINGIFNKTIDDNNAQATQEKATKMEMLQRLGIAPAANAPDLVGEAIQHGNNVAQQGRDSRTSESAINTQTDLNRNAGLANAIGNDGLQRRSQLNLRLQDVLGQLSGKEADYQSDYQKSKMEINNQGEDRAYQRWLQDRQFDQGLFNSVNADNAAMAKAQATAGSKASGSSDINGLMGSASPEMRQAMVEASSKFDIANEPQKVMQWLGQNHKNLNADEALAFVTNYAKVKGGKYADPNAG